MKTEMAGTIGDHDIETYKVACNSQVQAVKQW